MRTKYLSENQWPYHGQDVCSGSPLGAKLVLGNVQAPSVWRTACTPTDKRTTWRKKVSPLLDYGNTFQALGKKMAYNVAIKSSETAIRECLCKSKAFMRASALTGLKWQYLFVKVTLFSASRYKACRTCLEDRHISVREDCYLGW